METSRIGVIFDCDGTLIDSMGAWRTMEDELARRAGVTLTKADTDIITTFTVPECAAYFHGHFGLGDSEAEVVGIINEVMTAFYRERSQARPGTLELMRGLAELGVHLSVASSSPQPFLQAGLEHCGFLPYLDAVVSADDVGASKREPLIYWRARELMGTPLEGTWGIEDSVYALRTLRAAGFRTIGAYDCDLSGTWEELQETADHVILSFEELDAQTLVEWTR